MLPQHPPRRDHAHPSPPPSPAYNTRHPPFPFPPPPFPHLMPPPFPPPSMPPPFPPPNMPPPYWEPPRSPYARSHCSERDDRDYYRPYDSHRDDRYPPRDHSREPYYPRDRSQPPYTPRRLHYDEKYNSNYSSPREPIYSPPLPYPPPHDHSVSPPPRLHPPPIHPLKSNRSNRSSARLSYDYAGTRVYGDASHPSNHLPSQEDVIHGTDRHFGNHPRRKTPDPPQKTDHPPYPLDYRSKKHQNKPPPKNQPKKPLPVKRPAKPVPKPKDHVQPPEAPAPAAAAPAPAATPANGQPQQVSDIVADIVKNMQINSASPAPATQSSPPVAQPAPPQQPVTVSPPEQPSAAPHSSVSDKHTPTSTNSPAVVELPPACCDVKTSHPPAPASSSASAKSSERPTHRLEIVDPGVASVTQSAKQTPPTILVAPNASKSHGSSNRDHSSSRNDADTIEVTIGNTSASHTYHPPGNDPAVDIIWKKASKRLEIVDPEEMKPSAAPVASPECSPAAPQPSTSDSNSATISSSVGTPRANTSADMTNGTPGHTMAPVANRSNHISHHITKSESHAGTSADRLYPAASKSVGSNDPSKAHISGSQASRSIHAILDVTESSPELRQKPRPSMKYANGGASTDALDTSEVIDFSTGNAADDGAGAPGLCNEVLDAVVKIYATHCDPNYSLPWQMRRQTQSTSSGFVISGRRILTNAHSVEHHTVVRVKKRASDEKYIARVLATGNECDLALLTVIDEEFWQDLNPLQFGPLPELQASVIVIGYPIGGENISVTAGVVSRVEIQDYTHGASQLLGIQIDAAINSGSSGGPALNHRNEVVGIAFQSLNTGDSENIGYLVAESVVDHFLKDYERNKRYTGFCHCGFLWQRMENISLRRSMKMKDEENGILVRRVNKQSRALKVLREGDIVSHIDGIPISNAGTVPYRSGERISFHYIITTKFTGDPVKLNIIRNGEKMEIEYALGESSENLLVPVHEQRRQPEYLVVAGLVFVALSEPYLADEYGDKWDLKAPVRLLERLMYGSKETADEQVVVLSQVLNAEINIGYEYVINTRVHKFNGVKLRNLAQLAKLVETCEDDYLRFDLDDEIVVVGREEAIKSSKEIMKTHCIPSAYSIGDLPLHGIENGVLEEVEGLTSMGDNASENGLTQQNTGLSGDGLLPNGV